MPKNDPLGNRMKRYEAVSRQMLTPNMPVVVRVDGRAFHTVTRCLDRPFCRAFMGAMESAAVDLACEIQGFKAGYVQSDEATFVFHDYDRHESEGWFGLNHSKIVSISAAIMTANFAKHMRKREGDAKGDVPRRFFEQQAVFDSRAFNVPASDVLNCILWRMRDWHRNSIQMWARGTFSHKALHGKGRVEMLSMLDDAGKPWDLLPGACKNGSLLLINENGDVEVDWFCRPNFADLKGKVGHLFDYPEPEPKGSDNA